VRLIRSDRFTATHVIPKQLRLHGKPRIVAAALIMFVLFALTAVVAVSLTGFGSQGASGNQVSAVRVVQSKLCDALIKALPSTMKPVTNVSTGFDKKTNNASCTAIDKHANAATLYQLVSTGAKANKTAYLANVKMDMSPTRPDYGCSMSDQGQLDSSPQNAIPGTRQGYGCNIMVGAGNLATRVDALTKGNRSVSFSIVCEASALRNQSTLMVAQSAIGKLAKVAA
jgi:hypothetical protein